MTESASQLDQATTAGIGATSGKRQSAAHERLSRTLCVVQVAVPAGDRQERTGGVDARATQRAVLHCLGQLRTRDPSCFAVFLAPRWSEGPRGHAGDEWFVDLGA